MGFTVEFSSIGEKHIDMTKRSTNRMPRHTARTMALLIMLSALLLSFIGIGEMAFAQPASDAITAVILKVDGKQYVIRYIMEGDATIQNMTVNKNTKSLIVMLAPNHGNGTLSIQLPRNVIEAQDQNRVDLDYSVLVDGAHQNSTEFEKSDTARSIRIGFASDAKEITISGSNVVPEFGEFVFIVAAIAFVGVVIISRKILGISRKYSTNFQL